MAMMAIPGTLAEAVQALYHTKKEEQVTTVDIVGVLLNLSRSYTTAALLSPLSRSNRGIQKVEFFLADPTTTTVATATTTTTTSRKSSIQQQQQQQQQILPSSSSIRVVLYGPSEVARVEQEQIQVGDILRFNGVTLKKTAKTSYDNTVDGNGNNGIIVLNLSHDYSGFPGIRWCRLGNAITNQQQQKHPNENDNDIDADALLPHHMAIPYERVQELVEWWCTSKIDGATTHTSKSIDKMENLPCRKRQLNEIQSVGILSTIMVRVLDVRCERPTPARRHSRRSGTNKKRRVVSSSSSLLSSVSTSSSVMVVFASVTDSSGTTLTLIDASGQCTSALQTAFQQQKEEEEKERNNRVRLVLTNIRAKNPNTLRGLPSVTEEIVLVPTADTTACVVVVEEDNDDDEDGGDKDGTSSDDPERDGGQAKTYQHGRINENESMFVAGVQDIFLGGESLKQNDFAAFRALSSFRAVLIRHGGSYRDDGIVHITSWAAATVEKRSECHLRVGPSVVQSLCGGLNASELLEDDMLCETSMNLVRAILEEDILLRWTVWRDLDERRPTEATATKVVLHSL